MDKKRFPKKIGTYLPLVALFFLLVALMPRNPKFSYDYRKGSPWMYETLIAKFDFPILKTDAQMISERDEAGSTVIPYYRVDNRAWTRSKDILADMNLGIWSAARSSLADTLARIYSKGILSPSSENELQRISDGGLIYVQRERRAVKVPVSETYTMRQAEDAIRQTVASACEGADADSLFAAAGMLDLVIPDLIYDHQITDLVHEESVNYISRTLGVVKAGHTIVSNGEIVTAEIEQLLDSYREEYNTNIGYAGPRALLWIGNTILAFCIVLVLFLAIWFCNYRIFDQYNKYLYLLMIFLLSVLASSVVARTDPSLFYMIPFTLVALFLLAFFKKRVVFTVYMISLLPMLIFAPAGMELFVMYLVAGVVGILVFGIFNRGWLQFVTAFIVFLVMTCVWFAFRLVDGMQGLDLHVVFYMALGALMSVAGYPLVYLFEKMFRLVSNSKLIELGDTGNKLLRLLAEKTPGTFQHSLQVMNLADAVARSIDANVLLVRAGALYHDIGKICNPQCFTENENPGVRYHASLSPQESAQEIIKHVSDGLALADKHNLPQVIKEFINTHHGTTLVAYFYNRYLTEGGQVENEDQFRYDGVKPTTKEQVILMLCDAVEAASRSLKDYSTDSISELIERIVDGKIGEGQLADADISLRELNILKNEMKSYMTQVYHSRIAYPKRPAGPIRARR